MCLGVNKSWRRPCLVHGAWPRRVSLSPPLPHLVHAAKAPAANAPYQLQLLPLHLKLAHRSGQAGGDCRSRATASAQARPLPQRA